MSPIAVLLMVAALCFAMLAWPIATVVALVVALAALLLATTGDGPRFGT